jgi:hypothetical protein
MQCPSCQHDNPSTNLFCERCATHLGKQQVRQQNRSRVFIPPQVEMDKHNLRPTSTVWRPGWLLIGLVLILGIIWFYWYGQ